MMLRDWLAHEAEEDVAYGNECELAKQSVGGAEMKALK